MDHFDNQDKQQNQDQGEKQQVKEATDILIMGCLQFLSPSVTFFGVFILIPTLYVGVLLLMYPNAHLFLVAMVEFGIAWFLYLIFYVEVKMFLSDIDGGFDKLLIKTTLPDVIRIVCNFILKLLKVLK